MLARYIMITPISVTRPSFPSLVQFKIWKQHVSFGRDGMDQNDFTYILTVEERKDQKPIHKIGTKVSPKYLGHKSQNLMSHGMYMQNRA